MRAKKPARLFAAVILSLSLCLEFVPIAHAEAISARAYALVEGNSGRVIESGGETMRLPMASTTKIMTALLAVESGRLNETYTVPIEALTVEGSSMGLRPDEKITLRELVYGLMLESGNDAANSIAYMLSGSIPQFAERMNSRAQELGLSNTHFCNPSGLDDPNHYTSALDLARLAARAMKDQDFAKIVGTQKIRVSYDGIKNGRLLFNHNRLLGSYDGAVGVKTGFTKRDGRCLVSCAVRDGVALVAVTLNDPNDWQDHETLLNDGFKKLKSTPLFDAAPRITARVVGGAANQVDVSYDKSVTAALMPGELARVKMTVQLDRFYYAPIKKGQSLGTMVFSLDGNVIAESSITAKNSVQISRMKKTQNFFIRFWRNIACFPQSTV